MPTPNESYLLVVFDAIDDPDAVRDVLSRATKMHPTDAMHWVARMPGIGPRPLDKGQIKEVLDALYDLGVAAEARLPAAVPALHPVRNVHDVACLPEGLRVRGLRGEPIHWVPWPKIELIHAAWVEQEDETRSVGAATWMTAMRNAVNTVMGRPRMLIDRRPRTMRVAREPRRELVVVRREPLIALRLTEDTVNYAYLGAKRRPTAGENFPLLLQDLAARATDATLSPSTRGLLNPESAEKRGTPLATSQALIDDALLKLLWRWYQRDRERDLDEPGS